MHFLRGVCGRGAGRGLPELRGEFRAAAGSACGGAGAISGFDGPEGAALSTPRILIIARSDSGGGAGTQADIKTATTLGGHAMTAITALTAQNTLGVTGVMPVPADFV